MACVSVASMVVWLTTPMRRRSRSGSKPSEWRSAKRSKKKVRSASPRMTRARSSASARSRTTTTGAASFACENVARVSSWYRLPCTTTV